MHEPWAATRRLAARGQISSTQYIHCPQNHPLGEHSLPPVDHHDYNYHYNDDDDNNNNDNDTDDDDAVALDNPPHPS